MTDTIDPVAEAIAHHLKVAGDLISATRQAEGAPALNNAEIVARLDLILAKLAGPQVTLSEQLWDLEQISTYLHRNKQVVRQTMASLPSFPKAIRLPSEGRAQPLYKASEIIEWAASFQEKRRR